MKKTENEKGCWISYGISVLLTVAFFGIFFMGPDSIAQINNIINMVDCQDYECTVTETQYGVVTDIWDDCVVLCHNSYWVLSGGWFDCYLYPSHSNTKLMIGEGLSYYGDIGCSVSLRGRSMISVLSYISDGQGYVDDFRCVPCEGCCGGGG